MSTFYFEDLDHKYSGRERFDVYRVQEVLHPTRVAYLGYTERVPTRGMIILLFPDEIKSVSEEVNISANALQRYVMANELGHVYLNDYLLSRGFADRLLGGYTGSVPVFSFPFAKRALSFLEFHEAFSDVTSAKYGGLEMPSILDIYAYVRSGDVPPAYRFSIAMQNFAFRPTVQRYSHHMSEESSPNGDKPLSLSQVSAELRASPELAPLFFEDYIENLEGRLVPMAVPIARMDNSSVEEPSPAEERM